MSRGEAIQARFRHSFSQSNGSFTLDIDVLLPASGITAIWGASGSGKTTLLRCIAGLQRAEMGELIVAGQVWQSATVFAPVHERPIGYVFQDGALFEHLTAEQNLQYAIKRAPNNTDQTGYRQTLSLMGIEHLLERYPHQLSGGEKQRLAITRALLIQPKLLLMDEPLASLDEARKSEILPYLEQLHHQLDIPILYVTHARDEVARLADHIVALEHGRVTHQGSLAEVFSNLSFTASPSEQFVSVLAGRVVEKDQSWQLSRIEVKGLSLWLPENKLALGQQVRVQIVASHVHITLSQQKDSSVLNQLPASVVGIQPIANNQALVRVVLDVSDNLLTAVITQKSAQSMHVIEGKQVWAQIKSALILR